MRMGQTKLVKQLQLVQVCLTRLVAWTIQHLLMFELLKLVVFHFQWIVSPNTMQYDGAPTGGFDTVRSLPDKAPVFHRKNVCYL